VRKPKPTISRVLSGTTIHLGQSSPTASSNLPGSPLGTGGAGLACVLPYLVLLQAGFTVPRAVTSRAVRSYRTFSPLPSHARRYIFCGTFHGLTPPRRYLAPCPKEPGLSSANALRLLQRLSGRLRPSRSRFYGIQLGRAEVFPDQSLRFNRRRYSAFRLLPVTRAVIAAASLPGMNSASSSSRRSTSIDDSST